MKQFIRSLDPQAAVPDLATAAPAPRGTGWKPVPQPLEWWPLPAIPIDLLVLAVAFAVANAPLLLTGTMRSEWIFRPQAIRHGAWHVLLLHPFVHVSVYHALLDGSAFLLLYMMLGHFTPARRLALLAASCAGALFLPLLLTSGINERGLCGLSGAAHGLMAVVGVEMATRNASDRAYRRAGLVVLFVVVVKCMLEAFGGQVLLAGLHAGDIGQPIPSTHGGGVVGALLGVICQRASATHVMTRAEI